jgi:hypothetical protein
MEETSIKKFIISWIMTTLAMFSLSVVFHSLFSTQPAMVINGLHLSGRIMAILTFLSTATISLIFHALFYYGGFTCAPIKKGAGLGVALGFLYFMLMGFGLGAYNIHGSLVDIGGGMLWQVFEQGIGGMLASVLSITEIHRWGVFRMG